MLSVLPSFVLIILSFTIHRGSFSTSAPSFTSSSKCNRTFTTSYYYGKFYPLTGPDSKDWTDSVTLEFSVSASSNAHVLLSRRLISWWGDRVYEIALGANDNEQIQLRRWRRGEIEASADTPNLLSNYEERKFWITVSKDGLIEVQYGMNKTSIFRWHDRDPIHVRYYSFSTWPSTIGRWTFNCPKNETTEFEKEKIKTKLTAKERLHKEIIYNLDTIAPPIYEDDDEIIGVYISLDISRITLNVENSELILIGTATVEWNDARLIWDPSNYDGIEKILIRSYQSWKPNINLINPIEHKFMKLFPPTKSTVSISSAGNIMWTPKLDLHAACDLNFQNWPWDTHICKIHLSVWAQNVSLKRVTVRKENAISEWLPNDYLEGYVFSNILEWMEYTYSHFATSGSVQHDWTLELEFVLKRNTSFYHNLIFYLFIAVSLLLLMAVCTSPLDTRKIALNNFCVFLLTGLLMLTANSLPEFTQQAPTIVMAYSIMLVITLLYEAVCVVLIALIRTKHEISLPQYIVAVLESTLFATVCCIPSKLSQENVTTSKNNFNSDVNVKSITKSKQNILDRWLKLSSAIDNIFSFFILLLTIFLLNSF